MRTILSKSVDTSTYGNCLPMLLYSCEIWVARSVNIRSVDISWNNALCKIFNACWRESVKHLQFYCSCLPASVLVHQCRILLQMVKMVRSDNMILHTLARCSRESVVALLEKYSLGAHCEPSMLSICVVKHWFWLYFSNLCQAVWHSIRSIHSFIACSVCTAFIFILYIFCSLVLCVFYNNCCLVHINKWTDGWKTNDVH